VSVQDYVNAAMGLKASGQYGVKMGVKCAVHTHDSWVPLNDHHIWPLGDGGPDTADNKITVCCNAHYSIHAMIDYLTKCIVKEHVDPQWSYLRRFSPAVRELAWEGFNAIMRAKP
jgi:hypothetical protein